jgi:F-type H+-transporting ATPase subunit a
MWLWLLLGLVALGLLAFIPGGEKEDFAVAGEFNLEPLVTLPAIGPFDLSINKAVIYLWMATGIIVIVALIISRSLKVAPGRFQYAVEALYELARDGIVGSVMKSGKATWFPYVGAVFFFVLVNNLLGLLPLPFGEHHQPSFYAATANLFVTATLALFTFAFTHYAGIRKNGPVRYFKAWAPSSAPPVLKQVIFVIHAVSEVFRLISLSVRLFANMLAGHAILGVFFAMALIFQSYLAAVILQGGSVLIYLFEVFVAVIQAFIFAILSAVYIGGALDQEH